MPNPYGLTTDVAIDGVRATVRLIANGTYPPQVVDQTAARMLLDVFDALAEARERISELERQDDFISRVTEASISRASRWHAGDWMQWSGLEWAGAMCGEAGEAANVAKKLRRVEQAIDGNAASERPLVPAELVQQLARECSDVFLYLVLLAARYDIHLTSAIVATFNTKSIEMGFPERL